MWGGIYDPASDARSKGELRSLWGTDWAPVDDPVGDPVHDLAGGLGVITASLTVAVGRAPGFVTPVALDPDDGDSLSSLSIFSFPEASLFPIVLR